MADQGSTLLTAAKARELMTGIKESMANLAVGQAITQIKAAAQRGIHFVELSGSVWGQVDTEMYSEAVKMMEALGYKVTARYAKGEQWNGLGISGTVTRISW